SIPGGSFTFGKANLLREGDACTIIAVGEATYHALAAADELESAGLRVRLLDMPTVKPLDTAAVIAAARETGAILTVEEHSVFGGLGAAVAEVVVQSHPVAMRIIGFPDEFCPAGSSKELFAHYGLTGAAIAQRVRELVALAVHA
ncbi:MAG TPA: transketolase C-terminal domain-containing protein, partial [Spirochaetia bacterium]|nr:transketolase C-terminal domain-containing protein [Spirochaetia bacterium]